MDEPVDISVDVFHAGIRDHCRRLIRAGDAPSSLKEDRDRAGRIELVRQPPGQNATREVVDDGVQESLAAVEQPDDGRINVPCLVWLSRTETDLGLGRMDA